MPNPPFELTLEALDALAIGAWILGTGGGGDPYFSLLEAREQLAAGKRARVIDPLSLADDALVACVGQMGAPLVKQERLVDGPVIASTITMMEEYLGRKFEAVMLWEIGGNNGFQAILSGMLLDLPIVDCDAMGRAFPQADMTTFSICELTPYPWTMVDIRRNRIIFAEAEDWSWMERMTRRACTVLGSSAATCKAPRTGAEVKSSTCLHTVTQALRIGRTVAAAPRAHEDAVAAVVAAEGGLVLFRGKIVDVMRRTTEGWLRGTIEIDGLDADQGHRMRIAFQNEFVVAWKNEAVLRHRAGPDLPDGQRLRRCDRHRDRALRPARHRHRPAGAGHPHERAGAQEGRPAGLRLRPRFPLRVRGGAADDAHRHRRRRHQHGCRHDRGTAWCAMPSRARPPRTSRAASPGRWAICWAVAGVPVSRDRRGDDRHHALHQRGGAAPRRRPGRGRAHRAAGRGDAAAVRRLAARSARAGTRPRAHGARRLRGGRPADRAVRPRRHARGGAGHRRIRRGGRGGLVRVLAAQFRPREGGRRDPARGMPAASPSRLSHELGRIGLLARENVSLLNASLFSMARATIAAFVDAIAKAGIAAPLFITQNDGTVVAADGSGGVSGALVRLGADQLAARRGVPVGSRERHRGRRRRHHGRRRQPGARLSRARPTTSCTSAACARCSACPT